MSLTHALCHELGTPPLLGMGPIVFVVDDDISVRESLELLIRCEGWQPETFSSAPRIPYPSTSSRSELSGAGFFSSRTQWSRAAEAHRRRTDGHADHLHHRLRGRAHDGPSHEGGGRRILDEAIQ